MSSEIDDTGAMSAAELGRGFESGALDPRDIVEQCLARAEGCVGGGDGAPHIFARLTKQRARREAAAAAERAKRGLRRSALDGVPISWKDNFDLAEERTDAGAPKLAGRLAEADAPIVARLARAGAVCVGKTHMSELAFSGLGYNAQTATPPNRYDPAAVPGGSSSGAAASVATGCCAAAIGTDTGGSVRIPAAWNGLVGLKTTAGVLPMQGVAPLSPTLDTIGPLARTIEDAAMLLSSLCAAPPVDLNGASVRGRRFLCAEGLALEGMTSAGRDGYDRALANLRAVGAVIEPIDPPEFRETLELLSSKGAIVNTEGWAMWGDAITAQPEAISPMIRSRFQSGAAFRADQIDSVRIELKRLARSFLARIAGADALLLPSVANKAPSIAVIAQGGDAAMAENLLALRNTRLANVLGLCALSAPAGLDADGAPVSLMLFARPFEEARLLRLGAAIEAALTELVKET